MSAKVISMHNRKHLAGTGAYIGSTVGLAAAKVISASREAGI